MKIIQNKKIAKPAGEKGNYKKYSIQDLLSIMARLRSPGGCPWDRGQTEQTLKKYLIEEAFEVLEAIEAGTPEDLKEELGDLLLQILFLSRIGEEKKQYDFSDVVHHLADKLIRRHPHVFLSLDKIPGGVKPRDAHEVSEVWSAIKKLEGEDAPKKSILDGLPLSLPALERAQRLTDRASRVGFDWPDINGIWGKVQEELIELNKAGQASSSEAVEGELGDLLLSLVNWARFQGISAEAALRKANRRFTRRFQQVERELAKKGRTPQDSTLEEMDDLWNEAKKTPGTRRKKSFK